MRWLERLKQVAGWDLFLQILAVGVLIALGAFTLMTESCQGEANASTRIERADAQATRRTHLQLPPVHPRCASGGSCHSDGGYDNGT